MEELTPSWHAEHAPDAVALVMAATGETVTYAELEDRSTRLARALRARGVVAGDHIAVLMENNRPCLGGHTIIGFALSGNGVCRRDSLATWPVPAPPSRPST